MATSEVLISTVSPRKTYDFIFKDLKITLNPIKNCGFTRYEIPNLEQDSLCSSHHITTNYEIFFMYQLTFHLVVS